MFEIEIRAKISDLKGIRERIISLGAEAVKTEKQVDSVFGRKVDLDKEHKIIDGHFSARIRQKDNNTALEFKEIKRDGAGIELSCPLSRYEDGINFLDQMGFQEAFTITKNREIFELDNFELSLDQVDKLGDYLEIEHKFYDRAEKEQALAECQELLGKIDPKASIEPRKYGDLMQELINSKEKND